MEGSSEMDALVNNWQEVVSKILTDGENILKAILNDKSKCKVELAEKEREVAHFQSDIKQCLRDREMVQMELKLKNPIKDMSIRQLCLSLREWVYHEEMNLIRDEEQHIEAKIENLKLDMEHFKIVQYKLEAFESLLDIITEPPGAHTLRMPTDEKLRSTTFPGFANTEHLNQELEEIINNLMCHQQSVLNDDVYQKTMLTEAMQIVELLKEKIDTNFKQLLGEHNLKICNEIDELMHLCGTSCKQVDEMYYTFGTHMISRIVEGLDHQQVALKQLTMDIVDLNFTLDVNTLQICPMSRNIYSGLGADNFIFQTVKEKDLRDGDQGYRDIDRFEKELKNVSQMRGTLSENVNRMKDRLLEDKTVLTGVLNQLKKFISVACTIINCLRQPFGATMATDPQSKQNPLQFEVIYDRIESTRQQQMPFSVSQSLLETTDTRERKQNQVELKFADIKYSKIECDIKRFFILKSTCETVKGVLTICKQDFPNAAILNGNHFKTVVSSNIVNVYTTDEFRQIFEEDANVKLWNMSSNDVSEAIQQHTGFSLIVVNLLQQVYVFEALKTSRVHNAGILFVGLPVKQLPVLPHVYVKQTSTCSVIEADSLLEWCAMTILKAIDKSLKQYEYHREAGIVTKREKIQLNSMYNMIASCYKRSTVPSLEWPDVPTENFEYPPNIDKAIACIVERPGIIGCVKKSGILYIYIDESTKLADADRNIRSSLKQHEVTKYVLLSRTLRDFYSSGDSVFDRRGTLGGFVKMESLSTNSVRDSAPELARGAAVDLSMPSQTLVALVSRHVAQGSEYLTVGRTRIGRTYTFTTVEAIDILPVKVFEEYIANCDTTFKSEFGVTMRVAKLTETDDIQNLVGFPVHIWSDRSAPGLGILVHHEFIHLNGKRIIIRDRDEETPFSHDGDSGAMVCYSDPRRGNTLFAVAMIVGEITAGNGNTREYIAQILHYALQPLGVKNGCEFLFIEKGR